jgi:spore maturation protein A
MLNKIWFGLLCVGILYGFGKASYQSMFGATVPKAGVEKKASEQPAAPPGDSSAERNDEAIGLTAMGKRLNDATLEAAETSVKICISLIGIMALWLGLMNIAKDAGILQAFARFMRPVLRWLFPEVPDGHPAQGAMLMNIAANMLGMDNAATPLGLKAMEELQTLNPVKDTTTNSMVLFLAINNSSVTIIPFTLIGYRVACGSTNPAQPLAGILIVTTFSTIFAILLTKWLARRGGYRIDGAPVASQAAGSAEGGDRDR